MTLPDDWEKTTDVDHNITYHTTSPERQTITLIQRHGRWKVKGLTGFENYPLFAKNVSLSEAKKIANEVMESDSPVETMGTIVDTPTNTSPPESDNELQTEQEEQAEQAPSETEQDEIEQDQTKETNDTEKKTQASLTEFD